MSRFVAIAVAMAALAVPSTSAAARERQRAAPAQDSREIRYNPPPDWIAPPPEPSATPTRAGAAYRVILMDSQTRVAGEWIETYHRMRIQLLNSEALQFGRLTMSWNPADDEAIIHKVAIHRGGQETDVLAQRRFTILQREEGLEQSYLTGTLTGVLQVPGLQVGDELEYVWSHRARGGVLGATRFGARLLLLSDSAGTFRSRITWPAERGFQWRATPDIAGQAQSLAGGQSGVEVLLTDPGAIVPVEGAPSRFNRFRAVEFSEYADWPAVSRQFHPLFEAATTVTPGGPLDTEIARIAAQSEDPKARTEAALALVQDQVRYVYVGLDGGNYRPMTAEQTWQERYGDCKAKTVLLWAILRRLGIEAQPVLVNSGGGDGLDQQLPSPASFDHVLLRAAVAGQTYLLDGTRAKERDLALLDPLAYRWLLPITAEGTGLERGQLLPAQRPQLVMVIDYDASRGPTAPGRQETRDILIGGSSAELHSTFASASPEQVTRYLRSYWQARENDNLKYDSYDWSYDERRQALTFIGRGTMVDVWSGTPTAGYLIELPSNAGSFAPNDPERPADQDQQVPWTVSFPTFACAVFNIKLPPQRARFHWDFVAPDLDMSIAGTRYVRRSEMRDGVMRVVQAQRSLVPEIEAAQLAEIKQALPSFRESDAYLVETLGARRRRAGNAGGPIPLASEVDWAGLETPCLPAGTTPAG